MNQTSPSLRWNQFFMDLLTEKKKKETSIIWFLLKNLIWNAKFLFHESRP